MGSDEDISIHAIAMRCSELLTTQGHLAVRKTASENTTKLSNPTHDMHDINIHAACMPSV